MTTATNTREHLYDLLKDFDTAMLVTRSADGHMHSRPMAIAELRRDSDIYLVTSIDSPKVDEIQANPGVTLTFQSSNQYASLSGGATIVRDRALIDRLYKEAWKVWFPQGRNDPSIALLQFNAQHGEYWDNAGAEGLKYVFEAAKAYVKGEQPKDVDQQQHAKVTL